MASCSPYYSWASLPLHLTGLWILSQNLLAQRDAITRNSFLRGIIVTLYEIYYCYLRSCVKIWRCEPQAKLVAWQLSSQLRYFLCLPIAYVNLSAPFLNPVRADISLSFRVLVPKALHGQQIERCSHLQAAEDKPP